MLAGLGHSALHAHVHDFEALRAMNRSEPSAKPARSIGARLARLGRFVMFLLTAGWLFPHVCTEDLDLTAIQKGHMKERP